MQITPKQFSKTLNQPKFFPSYLKTLRIVQVMQLTLKILSIIFKPLFSKFEKNEGTWKIIYITYCNVLVLFFYFTVIITMKKTLTFPLNFIMKCYEGGWNFTIIFLQRNLGTTWYGIIKIFKWNKIKWWASFLQNIFLSLSLLICNRSSIQFKHHTVLKYYFEKDKKNKFMSLGRIQTCYTAPAKITIQNECPFLLGNVNLFGHY